MKKYIKYIKFAIALLLFFFGSYLRYIPIFLLKIDVNKASVITLNYLSIFSNALIFIILVLMYIKDIISGIKSLIHDRFKQLDKGFNYWFIGVVIMIISNMIISYFNNGGTSNNEESIRIFLEKSPVVAVIGIAILGPVIEELVFRKSFKDVFKNKWVYLFSSGIIFGALHVILSPINSFVDYLYLIPYCSMGIAFAYMYYDTDNIMTSITMHIFHNSLNVISTLLLGGFLLW